MSVRFHPAAVVTLTCFVLASTAALRFPSSLQWQHGVAIACFVSPLLLLLWAHLRLASTLGQQVWLAACSVPIAVATCIAVLLMGWFKPGWYGVAVFTALLFALAGATLLPLRRKKGEPRAA